MTKAVKEVRKRHRSGEVVVSTNYWLPIELKEKLDKDARANGRSSTQQIIWILEQRYKDE